MTDGIRRHRACVWSYGMCEVGTSSSAHPPIEPLPLRCAICDYDIHNNPGDRCPECGGTLVERRDWIVQRGRRQPRWILAGLAWMVLLSIAVPLLAAMLVAIAEAVSS